jgi:hypothetical protein
VAFVRRFFAFWYDFLVGDRWELFIGPIAALGVAWLLVQAGLPGAGTGLALFALVGGVAALSLALALRD